MEALSECDGRSVAVLSVGRGPLGNQGASVMSVVPMPMVMVRGITMTSLEKLSTPPKRDKRCGTLNWLIGLEDAARTAIDEALHNPDWRSTDLHKLLVDEFDYPLGYNQFLRHRSGSCCG